ncbi:LamG domain-containing protein, partial [bacterium]|nr:LamG domain-containing protein [bacterium]
QMNFAADDKRLEVGFFDNATNFAWATGTTQIQLGKWYNVAATYDNDKARLYIKEEGDSYYDLEAMVSVPAGADLGQWSQSWTVGRGMWGGNPTDFVDGRIDEVRICDIPLLEEYFLASRNIAFPFVNITNESVEVAYEISQCTISGTNNAAVTGFMSWDSTVSNGNFPAVVSWSVSGIPLDPGENVISISGTNIFGDVSSDSITITRMLPEPFIFMIYQVLFMFYYLRRLIA